MTDQHPTIDGVRESLGWAWVLIVILVIYGMAVSVELDDVKKRLKDLESSAKES